MKRYINKNKIAIILSVLITIILIISFTQLFAYSIVKVRGDSMTPTYKSGDVVIVNKLESNINRNDVIMIYYNGNKIIKRVVGIEGDYIELQESKLYINNILICNSGNYSYSSFSYFLLKNEYFVVGDNYEYSYDSRKFGKVRQKDIIGVICI